MAAVYFGSSDADKACDALVSDLLKAREVVTLAVAGCCLPGIPQDEEEAGETDVPEERSGEVTLMAESEEEPLVGGRPWVNGTVEPLQNRSELWKDVDTAVNV